MSRNPAASMPGQLNSLDSFDPTSESSTGLQAETIVLETRDIDVDSQDTPPAVLKQKLTLNNRIRGTTTEVGLFREHFLMLRLKRKGKTARSTLVNLRYIDTRPTLSRVVARRTLHVALGCLAGAFLAGVLAAFSVLTLWTTLFAVGATAAAAAALWLYAWRTTESIAFRTTVGRIPVFALRANLGCLRACRALVPSIVDAINEARRTNPTDREAYLRREMREHYRLSETGVLSKEACSAGTRRILGQFDSG